MPKGWPQKVYLPQVLTAALRTMRKLLSPPDCPQRARLLSPRLCLPQSKVASGTTSPFHSPFLQCAQSNDYGAGRLIPLKLFLLNGVHLSCGQNIRTFFAQQPGSFLALSGICCCRKTVPNLHTPETLQGRPPPLQSNPAEYLMMLQRNPVNTPSHFQQPKQWKQQSSLSRQSQTPVSLTRTSRSKGR